MSEREVAHHLARLWPPRRRAGPRDDALRIARKGYADGGGDSSSGNALDFLGSLSPGEQAIAESAPEIGRIAREELPSTVAELTPVPASIHAHHDIQKGDYGAGRGRDRAVGGVGGHSAAALCSQERDNTRPGRRPALVGGTAALLGSAADTASVVLGYIEPGHAGARAMRKLGL
jgi:hypothetical protein